MDQFTRGGLLRSRACPVPQSNAHRAWSAQFLQPSSDVPAAAVRLAWEPLLPGQPVPLIGEEVARGDSCDE